MPANAGAVHPGSLTDLPDDVLVRITLAVDEPRALIHLHAVCRSVRQLIDREAAWRRLFRRLPWRPVGWWADLGQPLLGVYPPPPFAHAAPWRWMVHCKAATSDAACDRWHDFRPTPAAMLRSAHFAATGRRLHELWREDEPSTTLHVGSGRSAGPNRYASLADALAHVRTRLRERASALAADTNADADVDMVDASAPRQQFTVLLHGDCVHEAAVDGPLLLEHPALTLCIVGLSQDQRGTDERSAAAPLPQPPVLRLAQTLTLRRGCRVRLVNLRIEFKPGATGVAADAAAAAADGVPPVHALIVKGGVGQGARLELDDVELSGVPVCVAGHGCLSARECRMSGAAHASAITAKQHAEVALTHCALTQAAHCGLSAQDHAYVSVDGCQLNNNARAGLKLVGACCAIVTRSELSGNAQMGVLVRDINFHPRPSNGAMPLDLAHRGSGAVEAMVTAPAKVLAQSAVRSNGHAGVSVIEHGTLALQCNELENNHGPGLLVQHEGFVEARSNVLRANAHSGARMTRAHAAAAPTGPGGQGGGNAASGHEIVLSHAAVLVSRNIWDACTATWAPSTEARLSCVYDEAEVRCLRKPLTSLADVGDFVREAAWRRGEITAKPAAAAAVPLVSDGESDDQ